VNQTNGGSVVHCDHVTHSYGHGDTLRQALTDVSCEVRAGDRIAIVGPSGSGKSTLLHLLAGLDTPSQGTVTWPAIGERNELRPSRVSVVFQAPSLLAPLTVVENVALPLILGGLADERAAERAAAGLARLGLAELADKLPDEISGGQAQRVAVARALVGDPTLILADEPTGQLDHATADSVMAALIETAQLTGSALVISTHDALVADRLDHTWTINDGRLAGTGAAACSA
jgi:ABC-type lipoprotein export system ATPase subunit